MAKEPTEEMEEETKEGEEDIEESNDVELLLSQGTWGPEQLTFFGPKTNSVVVYGEITEHVSIAICSQLLELSNLNPDHPIRVYINTPGGNVLDALAIYDIMRIIHNPITTIVMGCCHSAGLILLSGGDYRIATPNSMFFHHQPIASAINMNSTEEVNSLMQQYKWNKKKVDEIIISRTGMSAYEYLQKFGKSVSKYFDAQEALEYNFIDNILEHKEKMHPFWDEEEEE